MNILELRLMESFCKSETFKSLLTPLVKATVLASLHEELDVVFSMMNKKYNDAYCEIEALKKQIEFLSKRLSECEDKSRGEGE